MTAVPRVWMRFGRRARPGGRGSLWPAVLAVATAATVLVAVSLAVACAVYAGRDARETARVPQLVDENSADARLLWRDTHDSVGVRDATLITIEPLSSDAPLPPGLSAWPAPGEAVLSPALAQWGATEGIETRYGTVVGLIGDDGLASPRELLAYVRPTVGTVVDGALWSASGFGVPGVTGWLGESSDVEPLWKMLLAMTLVLGVPAGLLVVVAARAGQVERQRQALVLEILGAGVRERWAWAWGAIRWPFLAGTGVALAVTVALMLWDVSLPGRDFVVPAQDMRASWASIGLAALAAAAVVVWATLAAARPRMRNDSVRPRSALPTWPRSRAWVCLLAAPIATGAQLLIHERGSIVALVVYFVALVVVLWSLPQLVGWVTTGVAAGLRARARTRGDAATLVAAASLRHDARAVVRYAAVLAAAMIFTTQVQGYLAMMSESQREAAAVRAALDGRYVQIMTPPGMVQAWPRVSDAITNDPDLVMVLLVDRYDENGEVTSTLYGDPAALEAFAVEPSPAVDMATLGGRAGLVLGYSAIAGPITVSPVDGATIVADEVGDAEPQVVALVASRTGDQVPLDQVKQVVAANVSPMWRVLYPGDLWFLGGWLSQYQAGWAGWFGAIGVVLLTLAVGGAAVDDVRRSASRIAPLAVLVSRPDVYRRIVAWRLGVPLGIAVAIGAIISLVLRAALTVRSGALPSTLPAIAAMICGTLVVAFGLWAVTVASVARASARWTGRSHR